MPNTFNLLRSPGRIDLVPEICLRVAEHAIDEDPKAAAVLLVVSKVNDNVPLHLRHQSFRSLLQSYETSITKALSKHDDRLIYVNSSESLVLSSRIPPSDAIVYSLTYEWYLEMRTRSSQVEYLTDHEITHMDDDINGWPTLDVPKGELQQHKRAFKKRAFCLLYRLADCTAGVDGTHSIRTAQAQFLEGLNEIELSALGCLVEVIGQGFFNITKKALLASPLANLVSSSTRIAPASSSSQPQVTPPTLSNDLGSDNLTRERMCVFEDRIQRYGPNFAWSYLAGSKNRNRRPDLWAQSELQQGLDDMNAFELGYTMSYASLQSVVWRAFCRKTNCALQDSWNEARKLVESEMRNIGIEK
ncbi:hypothetical protein LOCC1_G000076 [Lachnellula occidentalis]|uniref:Uncharacterized protein n=1 Tax=Lachnellula occidentalis TaxID=215460 RepID=A0A8H8UIU4_9HELO|nr:hypothetical protein LOCC1_G000076 [Lachnellula occidentalis]